MKINLMHSITFLMCIIYIILYFKQFSRTQKHLGQNRIRVGRCIPLTLHGLKIQLDTYISQLDLYN